MGHDGTDKQIIQTGSHAGLSPESAAKISTENQIHPATKATLDSWSMLAGVDGLIVPQLELVPSTGDKGQISDCSADKCVVKGKQYQDSTDIPGNHPKPLLHADGKPVLGPDGKPVFGPDRIDLDKIATAARDNQNLLTIPEALINFRHSGQWDFQRMQSDDGRAIFTKDYQNFANIGIGYILGALGMNLKDMSQYADTYCKYRCVQYDEPKSPQYPHLADRQVKDFQIGMALYKERHPDGK